MQRHLDSVSRAKSKGDWSLASAALGFAKQMLEGEGKETPTQWRCWNIEFRMARGDWDGAADAVRDAIRYENNSPDVHALRGKIFFLTNKSTDAANSLRHALTLDPEHGTARTLLKKVKQLEKIKDDGNAAFKQSKWEEACKKYAEALEIVGENPEEAQGGILRATLLSNRATAYSKVGTTESYDKALADLDVSVKLHPDNWKAVRTRARIHLAKDEFELAISDFREATELAESSSGAGVQVQSELREEIRKAEVLLKRSKEKDYYSKLSRFKKVSVTDPSF
jgi:DnaJ family protein C protein 7